MRSLNFALHFGILLSGSYQVAFECPDSLVWVVEAQDSADGNWYIPGDLVVMQTTLPGHETKC